MSVDALAGLLARRLEEVGRVDDEIVSVAELHRTLLPYHICRNTLGYATKAEYDVELLELLAAEQFLFPAESELRSAVSVERTSPEPGLGFLKNFAAAQLRIQPTLASSPSPAPAGPPPQPAEDSAPTTELAEPAAQEQEEKEPGATPCWRCREELPDRRGLRYCVFCGSDQQRPRCLACEEELEGDWRFCPRCGADRLATARSA
jgi:hypothetical protein